MKYTLITGGAGFIGSHLTDYLIESNENVIVFDNLSTGNIQQVNKKAIFIEGDIRDSFLITSLLKEYEINKVIHLAAVADVSESIKNPLYTHKVNLEASLNILEALKNYNYLERIVFASSAAVYGDNYNEKLSETSIIHPKSPYGIEKFASEQYMLTYSKLFNLPATALRFFNVFGERQNPKSDYAGVISIITRKMLNNKYNYEDIFEIYGDGNQTRDFIYVKDVIKAIFITSNHKNSIGNVYNVGLGAPVSLNEIIQKYEKLSCIKLPHKYKPFRNGDILHSVANIEKIKSLKFYPEYTVDEGIKSYWEYSINEFSNKSKGEFHVE